MSDCCQPVFGFDPTCTDQSCAARFFRRTFEGYFIELADATPAPATAENYADYPLIVLSQDRKKEVTRVTADGNGNYRAGLPPGDYVLDVQRRPRGRVRATPQPFTVVSGQTVRVDMDIDTGVR